MRTRMIPMGEKKRKSGGEEDEISHNKGRKEEGETDRQSVSSLSLGLGKEDGMKWDN